MAFDFSTLTPEQCGVGAWFQKTYTVYIHFSALIGTHVICTFSSKSDTYEDLQKIVRNAFIYAFNPPTLLTERYFEKDKDYGKHGYIHLCHSDGITIKTEEGYEDNYQCTFLTAYCADVQKKASNRHTDTIHIHTTDNWTLLDSLKKEDIWTSELQNQIKHVITKNKVQPPT